MCNIVSSCTFGHLILREIYDLTYEKLKKKNEPFHSVIYYKIKQLTILVIIYVN